MGPQKIVKTKILLVEDDEDVREIYSAALIRNGFEVILAVNGEEGLEKALKNTPDLILLDILLPIMNGFAMLKKLREENEYGKNVPVILLTNLSPDFDDILKGVLETDPAYYIVKVNFSPQQVVEKIRDVLFGLTPVHEPKRISKPERILIPAVIIIIIAAVLILSKNPGRFYSLAAFPSSLLLLLKRLVGL
ncbi:MAG: response regulator [Candidatus Staskawiczbacteria bacterium]|nr:response regulator [Candidatus Staskawiczbacteria bacterium]